MEGGEEVTSSPSQWRSKEEECGERRQSRGRGERRRGLVLDE
jgi:hypothetical protein